MNYRHRQAHSVRSCRMLPRTLSKDLAREIHMTEMRLWLNRIHATRARLWASFFFGEEHDIDIFMGSCLARRDIDRESSRNKIARLAADELRARHKKLLQILNREVRAADARWELRYDSLMTLRYRDISELYQPLPYRIIFISIRVWLRLRHDGTSDSAVF